MRNDDEKIILEDYKKAIRRYYARKNGKIINLDKEVGNELSYIVQRLEDLLPRIQYDVPPQHQSRLHIIYVKKGEGHGMIGPENIGALPRTLMIIPSHVIYSGTYEEGTTGYFLSLNVNFFLQENLPRHHLANMRIFTKRLVPFVRVNCKQCNLPTNIFETILKEHAHNSLHKEEMIALKILELLLLLDRLFLKESKAGETALPSTVVQYIDLIDEYHKEHHTASYYAAKLHMHPNVLNALCKKHLGKSAKSLIDTKLLNEAKNHLRHTSSSAKEIAFDMGFNSSSQFFRFFKKHAGFSPLSFRRAL